MDLLDETLGVQRLADPAEVRRPDPATLRRHAEAVETAAAEVFFRAAPPAVVSACGLRFRREGEAFVGMATRLDVLAQNRVIGLGALRPADEEMLDLLVQDFRRACVPRFFVQVAPDPEPPALTEWLRARGFTHHNNWAKLYRGAEPPPHVETSLRVEEARAQHRSIFGNLVRAAFQWPRPISEWLAATVGGPGWKHYLAYDGGKPAAAGALLIHGDTGWLAFGATHPSYRGRGAQSALAARRIRDGLNAGCTRFIVETAEDTPEHGSTSFRNMIRLGFRLAYLRANWLLRPEPEPEAEEADTAAPG